MRIRFLIFVLNICLISLLHAEHTEDVFTDIYKRGEWGKNAEGQGHSGEGSTDENTKLYRFFLQDFLHTKQIKSVVDFGCGDWQFSKLINWNGIDYMGIDVVKQLIDTNQAIYGSVNINFFHAVPVDELPKADLLICKDVLQHLPNDAIDLFLLEIKKYKHCLITNDVHPETLTSDNHNIHAGHYRLLDLIRPPFNLKGTKILTYISGGTTKQVLYVGQ